MYTCMYVHSSGGRALTAKVRGPRFNPGWLSVFLSSLKKYSQAFPHVHTCVYMYMYIHVCTVTVHTCMYCNCILPQHMYEFTYIYMLPDPNWDAWSNNLICSPILAQTARVISATGWLSSTITVFMAPSSVCTRRALCLVRYSTTLWREGGRGKRESEVCAHRSVLYVCVHAHMACVGGGGEAC